MFRSPLVAPFFPKEVAQWKQVWRRVVPGIRVIKRFLDVEIECACIAEDVWEIAVKANDGDDTRKEVQQ